MYRDKSERKGVNTPMHFIHGLSSSLVNTFSVKPLGQKHGIDVEVIVQGVLDGSLNGRTF